MKNLIFVAILLVVLLDGMILLIVPAKHAVIVNRWNELMRIPARLRVDRYQGLRWRLSGLALVLMSLYVIAQVVRSR